MSSLPTEFASYTFLPAVIDGAPMEPGTQVEVRVVATVARSPFNDGILRLRIDDWGGPTPCARVVDQ
jgi:hypothetical protein